MTGRPTALLILAAFLGRAHSQEPLCVLPDTLARKAGETFRVEPACRLEPGSAYAFQWDPGDGRAPLPWSDSAALLIAYPAPDLYPLVLKVSVDGIWNPSNTFTTTVRIQGTVTPKRASRSSTLAYDAARKRVWNVNLDQGTITAVDARTLSRLREFPVGERPMALALDALGNPWVTVGRPASLARVDAATGAVDRIVLPYASRPSGIVVDTARSLAYVALEALGQVAKIDLAKGAVLARTDVFPTPRALALDGRGERLLAARLHTAVRHALPPDSARAELAEIATDNLKVTHRIPLDYDASADSRLGGAGVLTQLRALAIHPDGRRAFVGALKANVFRGLFRDGRAFDGNGENTLRSAVAVVDLETRQEIRAKRLDVDDSGVPAALAFTADGMQAILAAEGSNSVEIYAAEALRDLGTVGPHHDGALLAPDGLALSEDDSLLFVHHFTTRTLAIYDRTRVGAEGGLMLLETIPLVASEALPPAQLRGQQIFHNSADPRLTKSGYISCAACHPGGGSDNLVWDFTDRGEGLRRTLPLLGRAGTAHGPLHWSANFDEVQDFEHDIRGPFGGTGLLPDAVFAAGTRASTLGDPKAGLGADLDALAAYVAGLSRYEPSPWRAPDGSMTAEAEAGRLIFHRGDVGCAACHAGPHLTDSDLSARPYRLHDVGTLTPGSGKRMGAGLPGLDTPTLIGIWRFPPYLHDGSAATLRDVLTVRNPGDRHGRTSHLSALEIGRLEAFLLQLDGPGQGSPAALRDGPGRASPRAALLRRGGGWVLRFDGVEEGPLRLELRNARGEAIASLASARRRGGAEFAVAPGVAGGLIVYRLLGARTASAGRVFLP